MLKNSLQLVLLVFAFICTTSCSKEDSQQDHDIGSWQLVEWNIGIDTDFNNDCIMSTNILDEFDCDFKEVVSFDSEGLMTHRLEYLPIVDIRLRDVDMSNYTFQYNCGEGIISNAVVYTREDLESYILEGNTMTTVTVDAVEIQNEAGTEVVSYLTSTKVYTRQ